MTTRESAWGSRATAYSNGDFISIETCSGRGLIMPDPEAPEHLFSPEVSNELLGMGVVEALNHSKFLSIEEAGTLQENTPEYYKNWVRKVMDRYGYKTKNALFRKMRSCGIKCHEDVITICPSHHEKLEAWGTGFITEEDYVKIPADSSSAEIGAALRLAFSRCTGIGT